MRRLAPLALAALLVLAGCATSPDAPDATTEPTPSTTTERTEVDWSQHPTDYQRIVDEETADKDCAALQEMFDAAPDDVALLSYLDESLELAGCY